ncbi:MAG: thiamine phosphate synthase [Myxococcota bacterium]
MTLETKPRGQDYQGLHVLADDDPRWGRDPVEQAKAACAAGVEVVQLRAKHATDEESLRWAKAIRELTRASGTRFVVNDRFDLALLAEADGVHLGQGDLPPSALPAARAQLAVGRSTHTPEQLDATRDEDVDYVAFGPVFGTTSKASEYEERGLAALRGAVRRAAPRPLIAIGGITPDHLGRLADAGVRGFAVISAVAAAADPEEAARKLSLQFRAERERAGMGTGTSAGARADSA